MSTVPYDAPTLLDTAYSSGVFYVAFVSGSLLWRDSLLLVAFAAFIQDCLLVKMQTFVQSTCLRGFPAINISCFKLLAMAQGDFGGGYAVRHLFLAQNIAG